MTRQSTLLAAALLGAQILAAQIDPVTLAETTAVRGETVGVVIPNGPAAGAIPSATLSRSGVTAPATVTYANSRADVTVPSDLPFGDYLVIVSFTAPTPKKFVASKRLSVLPDGKPEIRLAEFDPPATYQTETVYVPDTSQATAQEIEVEDVTIADPNLKGKQPPIEINGETVHVIWNNCRDLPPLGNAQNPVVPQIFADNSAAAGLKLCRVPVNAKIRIDGNDAAPTPTAGSQTKLFKAVYTKARKIRTANLILRGSGFLASQPQDTSIWINGARIQPIWDSCDTLPDPGNAHSPVIDHIHGQIVNSTEAKLCRVEIPAGGHLMVAAGYGDTRSEARLFEVYRWGAWWVGILSALIAFALAGIVFLLLTSVRAHIGNTDYRWSLLFLDPETNTYSLSKLQFYLWTMAALFSYAYLFLSKVFVQNQAWPDIPSSLPGVIAIGAGTTIGSQVVTGVRGSKGAGPEKPGFCNFVTSGGVVAPDRVQMFVWTLFGVSAFCIAVLRKGPGTIGEISPVPDGMLYLMGLSSAGYLGGKLARKPGPVINEISVSPAESDDTLAASSSSAGATPDFSDAIATARAALANLPQVTGTALTAVTALRDATGAAGAAHTSQDLAALIPKLASLRQDAERAAVTAAAEFTAGTTRAAAAQAAQSAAAALQDFTAGITEALSLAAAPVMDDAEDDCCVARTIDLRGTNMSPEGNIDIDGADLPFRMMRNRDGRNAPDVIASEDGSTLARVMRISINPDLLGASDRAQFKKWFGKDGSHMFSLTNPDGQKAEVSFNVPPGEGVK